MTDKIVTIRVPDMTCDHCVKTITAAIKKVHPVASVNIDLTQHLVKVTGVSDAEQILKIIKEEDYTPELAL